MLYFSPAKIISIVAVLLAAVLFALPNLFDKETGFMRTRHADGRWQEAGVEDGRKHGKGLVARLAEVEDREAAAALIGRPSRRNTAPDGTGGVRSTQRLAAMWLARSCRKL